MENFDRVVWIVLDSVGIGALPDAADYDDIGRNTLGHIAESRPLNIPNLAQLGLANIAPLKHLPPAAAPLGAYGKGATRSPGKDTTTGHWEMAGVWLDQAFPVYKSGFPADLLRSDRASRCLRQRRDSLAWKRYDHRTLGNGRRVARPGISGLQKRIPCRSHR